MARIPGVAAADGLAFVDLPPGSLQRRRLERSAGPVRVFAFDRRYQEHYPSIRVTAGSLGPRSALLSAEASRALGAEPGAHDRAEPARPPRRLSLPVSGVADLARAKPLFSSRSSSKLEDFLYVPDAVVVSPGDVRARRSFRRSAPPGQGSEA